MKELKQKIAELHLAIEVAKNQLDFIKSELDKLGILPDSPPDPGKK